MPVTQFPNPREVDTSPDGLIAIGGDLHPKSLVLAYSLGIFPWPSENAPLLWFCPERRAVLEFDRLHIPRSLERSRRRGLALYRYSIDEAFERVITQCSRVPRPGQNGTWITPELKTAYLTLHRLGIAHSVEVWSGEALVGGIYGVNVAGCFAGESMFHRESDTSKLALLHLVDHLRERGLDWIDIQMLTPHMEALGAREIPKLDYLTKLEATQGRGLQLF